MNSVPTVEVRVQVLDHEGNVLFEASLGAYRNGYAPLPTGMELATLLAAIAGQGGQVARALMNGNVWREVHRG